MAIPKPIVKISWTANTPKKILSMRESRMQVPSVRAGGADSLQERCAATGSTAYYAEILRKREI